VLKNSSANQTVRLVAGKIRYIDAQGQPIKLEDARTEPTLKFASYGNDSLDPGQEATESLDVDFPAEALKAKTLKEIHLELAYIPSPYRERRSTSSCPSAASERENGRARSMATTGIYLVSGVSRDLQRAARVRAVSEGTTLRTVLLESLGEYAAGNWTPHPDERRSPVRLRPARAVSHMGAMTRTSRSTAWRDAGSRPRGDSLRDASEDVRCM